MHTHSKLCDKWIVSTWFQSVSYLSYIPLIIQSYTFLFSLPMHVLISVDTAATKTDDWVRDCLACSCCMVWSMERRHRCIEKEKEGRGCSISMWWRQGRRTSSYTCEQRKYRMHMIRFNQIWELIHDSHKVMSQSKRFYELIFHHVWL